MSETTKLELSDWDRKIFMYFGKKSPVVPLGLFFWFHQTCTILKSLWHSDLTGCVITAGVLFTGFYHFKKGNKRTSNIMMRARVATQAVTVGLMMFSLSVTKKQKELGIDLWRPFWRMPNLFYSEIMKLSFIFYWFPQLRETSNSLSSLSQQTVANFFLLGAEAFGSVHDYDAVQVELTAASQPEQDLLIAARRPLPQP